MKSISILCPNMGCDKGVVLADEKIKRAVLRKKQTGGQALIGCPACAHVMILPDIISTEELFKEFIATMDAEGGWLEGCVPMLDDTQAVMPAGHVTQAGTTLYRPGNGSGLFNKYEYMMKFGIDPEIAEYKSGKKPAILGDVPR